MTRTLPSPPIASIAIRGAVKSFIPRFWDLGADGDDFAAVIMPTGRAELCRRFSSPPVRAFLECLDRKLVMAAAHACRTGEVFLLGTAMRAPVQFVKKFKAIIR